MSTIALMGPSCSGKSTIAEALCKKISKGEDAVLSLDSYYMGLPPDQYPDSYNFDHPHALDIDLIYEHLKCIRRKQSIKIPIYDFKTHTRLIDQIEYVPSKLNIIEGLYCGYISNFRDNIDVLVYVDIDKSITQERRLKRDLCKRGRTRKEVISQLEKYVFPMWDKYVLEQKQYADIVLDGSLSITKNVENICEFLNAQKEF
jgi:uridine kinase